MLKSVLISYRSLSPGAHVELVELDLTLRCSDGTLSKDGPTSKFHTDLDKSTKNLGFPMFYDIDTVKTSLEHAGFSHIEIISEEMPLSIDPKTCKRCEKDLTRDPSNCSDCLVWPKSRKDVIVGERYRGWLCNETALESISNAVFAIQGTKTRMPVEDMIKGAVEEMETGKVHASHML